MKMRNLSYILSGGMLLLALSAGAATLTPDQALQRARNLGMHKVSGVAVAPTLSYTLKAADDQPALYVFANNDTNGFSIVSADDVAYPLLGYSDNDPFDADNIPPQLQWWLNFYADQINAAKQKGVSSESATSPRNINSEWSPISPLLSTKWNQDAPYNNMCPTIKNMLTYTGCVATSMAQVMNYFKYPDIGEGKVLYRPYNLGKFISMNFEDQPFDWDHMLPAYYSGSYTETEANAVAYLMKACGYGVEMNYGTDSSGASSSNIAKALRTYFKYDNSARYVSRDIYSSTQWAQMIYDNLKTCGPVIYDGHAPLEGGHSFVCDGYDGNGYFHFNWGWGGISDGYYSLDALNPEAQGIGGYAGGFNTRQDVVLGIRIPDGNDYSVPNNLYQYGSTVGTLSGYTLKFGATDSAVQGIANLSGFYVSVNIGASVESISDMDMPVIYLNGKLGNLTTVSLETGTYYTYSATMYPSCELPDNLADGIYKVTLCTLDTERENATWLPITVDYGCPNYVLLTVENGAYSVSNVTPANITIEEAGLGSTLYYNKNVKIHAKVVNDSDYELSKPVMPVLYQNGNRQFAGDCVLLTLQPDETIEMDWIVKFQKVGSIGAVTSATDFTLNLEDPISGKVYGTYGTVTMNPSPGSTSIMPTGFAITNYEQEVEEVPVDKFQAVYIVTNPEDIEVSVGFKVTKGYFDNTFMITVSQRDPENPSVMIQLDELFQDVLFLSKGETWENTFHLSFPEAVDKTYYYLLATYVNGYGYSTLSKIIFRTGESGVDGIYDSEDAMPEFFSLQGVRILNPKKGDLVIRKTGSKVEKIIVE